MHSICLLVSQATPFAERGRVWSRCKHRVVPTAETWCDQSDPRSQRSHLLSWSTITSHV